MWGLLQLPGARHLHERQLLFPALVLIVVAGVLIHGALDRERAARAERGNAEGAEGQSVDAEPRDAGPPLRARPRARLSLRGDLEKTPLTYFSDYWAQLAAEMGAHLLELGAPGQSGLVIEPGLAVTSVEVADALEAVAARARLAAAASETTETAENGDGDTDTDTGTDAWTMVSSGVRAVDRTAGLALVEVDAALPPFVEGNPLALPSGSYVGAVTLDVSGAPSITPGYLVSASSDGDLVISTPLPRRVRRQSSISTDCLSVFRISRPTGHGRSRSRCSGANWLELRSRSHAGRSRSRRSMPMYRIFWGRTGC